MPNLIALIALISWPVIPLFWIPVHLFPHYFRRIRFFTYIMPVISWLPTAYFIYCHRDFLLQFRTELPVFINGAGGVLLIIGTGIHIWTGKLLSLWGLIGVPEIYKEMKGKMVTYGAFSLVRHPTYLAHTLMFTGVFLLTGVFSIAVVAFVDFTVVNLVIIPLEERELSDRFGDEYRRYKENVPKFFPRLTRVSGKHNM
jgi:protein-S-isoprenylcysteine O-methyltransferase Ste14